MSVDISIIQADRQAIIADLSISLTINGKAYTGRKTNLNRAGKTGENGFKPGYKGTICLYTTDVLTEDMDVVIGSDTFIVLDVDRGTVPGCQTIHIGSGIT